MKFLTTGRLTMMYLVGSFGCAGSLARAWVEVTLSMKLMTTAFWSAVRSNQEAFTSGLGMGLTGTSPGPSHKSPGME